MIKKNQPEPLITIIAERSCLRGQSGQSCDRTWEEESGHLAGASLSTGHQVPPVLDDGDGQVVLGPLDVGLEEGKESGLGELLNVPGDVLPLDIDLDVVIKLENGGKFQNLDYQPDPRGAPSGSRENLSSDQ